MRMKDTCITMLCRRGNRKGGGMVDWQGIMRFVL